jgi:phage gpG-like protein
MFQLTFTVAGEEQINRSIGRFLEGVSDFTPAFEEIAEDFLQVEAEQFASEGGYGLAGRWLGLSPTYAQWKAKNFPGAKILERTGALRDSLTSTGGPNVREITPTTLSLGTKVPYAIYHQQGRGVPKRKPIDLNEETKQRWMKFIQAYLVEKQRGG